MSPDASLENADDQQVGAGTGHPVCDGTLLLKEL